MKTRSHTTWWAGILGAGLAFAIATLIARAELGGSTASMPHAFVYRGYLERSGAPVVTSTVFTFRLRSGTNEWLDTHTLTPAGGNFVAVIGSSSANPAPDWVFSGAPVDLQVDVAGTALGGAQRIYPVPFAIVSAHSGRAEEADHAIEADRPAGLGAGSTTPGTSCAAILAARPGVASGVYWVSFTGVPIRVYCDMVTDGGGWTLVASNLREGEGKPFRRLSWQAAVNARPRYWGEPSNDLEAFIVYTGVAHWEGVAPAGQLRYDWAADYGRAADQSGVMSFSLDEALNYTLRLTNYRQRLGTTVASLYQYHRDRPLSTFDRDNDPYAGNCADSYAAPFWYASCWDGSIFGDYGASVRNAAYWSGASAGWGVAAGTGGGNGWIFVR